jgi:branched-chain amino acid transport system substrate-binding protein
MGQSRFPFTSGRDLFGRVENGRGVATKVRDDIFNSPPTTFSKTNHLANTIPPVQQIKNGRWVLMKDGLMF